MKKTQSIACLTLLVMSAFLLILSYSIIGFVKGLFVEKVKADVPIGGTSSGSDLMGNSSSDSSSTSDSSTGGY